MQESWTITAATEVAKGVCITRIPAGPAISYLRKLHRPARVGEIGSPQSSKKLGLEFRERAPNRRIRIGVETEALERIVFVTSTGPPDAS